MKKQSFFDAVFQFFGIDRDESPIPVARHAASNIPILFNVDPYIFPEDWTGKRVNAQATRIRRKEVARSISVISKAMDKYPVDFLKKNLKSIIVFKQMSFFNLRYGGTHSIDRIYLTNDGIWKGYSDDSIELTFHHEMASILLQNYPQYIDKEKWTKQNLKAYSGDGVMAIANLNVDKTFYRKLHKSGFLHAFSSSGFRNDFVSFAENILMGNPEFFRAVETFPIIKKKYQMMTVFYYMVDAKFTPAYFRRIQQH